MSQPKPRRERVNPPVEQLYAHRWKIFAVMMIGWSMSLIDSSIVNIAVPELQRDLHTDVDTVTWVINGYNITFAVLLVAMGRLADQFGRRRFFLIGMTLFTVGSALCAASWSIDSLIFFRVVQGAGAGTLAPLGFAMTALVFPPKQRGVALSMIAVVALVSTAIGPVLGGAILELGDWQWIFLINVPFGILGIILARRIWPETYDLTVAGRRIDIFGMVLLAASVFSLTFSLAEANKRGWDDALILFLLQASVLFAIAFWLSQRYGKSPMLTPSLIRNKQFVGANIAMLLFAAGALGALFLISLVFQSLWGYGQWDAALALLPIPLTGMLSWPLVGRTANKRPPRRLAIPALFIMAIGLFWVSFVPSTSESWTDYALVLPGLIMIGFGMGTIFPTVNVGAMGAVTGPELGLASGVVNTSRQLGTALGIALLVATLSIASNVTVGYAREDIKDVNRVVALPRGLADGISNRTFADFLGRSPSRLERRVGFDQLAAREMAGAARDAYGWGFRIAGLLVLLAIPFARSMRFHPGAARPTESAAGASPPPDPESPPEGLAQGASDVPQRSALEARIAELESSLGELRTQLDDDPGWIDGPSTGRRAARTRRGGPAATVEREPRAREEVVEEPLRDPDEATEPTSRETSREEPADMARRARERAKARAVPQTLQKKRRRWPFGRS